MDEILVIAEHRQNAIREITFEMLNLAGALGKEKGWTVTALLPGQEPDALTDDIRSCCDRLLTVRDPGLSSYNPEYYIEILEKIFQERRPKLTLIGHTSTGMDLAPALAARLSLPLLTDCLEVGLPEEGLTAQRQIYGGKVQAIYVLKPFDSYILTIRPGAFKDIRDQGKSGGLETVAPPAWTGLRGRRFLELMSIAATDVDITAAEVLVSVGRGIGKPENIPIAREFADAIGATLSCSRPVADEGWLPKTRQVGTSGKTVRPKVYIALGISGAYQHVAGMKNAETILAVNSDPRAPIFSVAHYGIVGDMLQVLPVLKEKMKVLM